jgi:hypothetical protein
VAAPFVITSPTNTVVLGPDRTGEAAFSVSNQTGRAVRARAAVAALDQTQAVWLSIVGTAERDFPVGGMEQFTVAVTVPPEVVGGLYPLRLDIASVVNPDEDWAQGPVVAFQVPEIVIPPPPPPPPEPPGYIETLLGAFAGGVPLGAIGVGIGLLLLLLVVVAGGSGDPWADLAKAIGTALISLFLAAALGILGLWIGSAVGAWVTLRARGFAQPGLTAVPLAILFPVWAIFVFIVVISILSAVNAESGIAIVMALVLAALLAVAVPALGARAFARWRLTGGL